MSACVTHYACPCILERLAKAEAVFTGSGLSLYRVELTFAGQTFTELVAAADEESALRRGENNYYPARAVRAWRVDTIDGCQVVVVPP